MKRLRAWLGRRNQHQALKERKIHLSTHQSTTAVGKTQTRSAPVWAIMDHLIGYLDALNGSYSPKDCIEVHKTSAQALFDLGVDPTDLQIIYEIVVQIGMYGGSCLINPEAER